MTDETIFHVNSLDRSFQPYAAYFLNAARAAGIPAVVISGRRSATANREAGGAPRSLHLYGFAFDVGLLGYQVSDLPFSWWLAAGEFWEALGGRCGGRFGQPDVNHFDAGYSVRV